MKVKICGIRSYEDALMAADCGADALGFNFHPGSPRYISPVEARGITRRLPPFVSPVGLFVNVEDPAQVQATARESGVHVVQLHGTESADYCRRLSGWTLIKALRPGRGPVGADLAGYPVSAFLLDTWDPVLFGGTGRTFDWSCLPDLPPGPKVILAGGLAPVNVAEAIRAVRPFAVDVCSGVESSPGKKDRGKLEAFMREVRNA